MVGVPKFGNKPQPPYRFRPPRHVPLFMWFAERIAPIYMRRQLKVSRIEIDEHELQLFEQYRGERVIVTPNHPTQDPAVLFMVSRRLGMDFYWMAARELLEHPLQGPVVSRLGVYSIDRGRRDEASLNTTVRLLLEGQHWVVIFPEGINHLLHGEIMPFLPGAARLGLSALHELRKGGAPDTPVYLLPMALRYYYLQDMQQVAIDSLGRLEKKLGLPSSRNKLWQDRLAIIANMVLELNERHYNVVPVAGDNEDQRLQRLKQIVLRRVAEGLGVEPGGDGQSLRNRIRKLLNLSSMLLNEERLPGGGYARELSQLQKEKVISLRRDLGRLAVFMPLKWNYEIEVPTVENFLDVLNILEMDLLGRAQVWGPRGVRIRVGQPLDLREYHDEFLKDPRGTSERVMHRQESAVRELLDSMADTLTPLPKSLIFQR